MCMAFRKVWAVCGGTIIYKECSYNIYKHLDCSECVTLTARINNKYVKTTDKPLFKWQLIQEEDKNILGYSCKKATTSFAGRNYEAWYNPEIPISDGPYKFSGLPGLIVKLNDTQQQHRFELTSIKKPSGNKPLFLKQHKNEIEITRKEFIKAFYVDLTSLYNRFQSEERINFDDDETKARALNNIKSRNNYIEKY